MFGKLIDKDHDLFNRLIHTLLFIYAKYICSQQRETGINAGDIYSLKTEAVVITFICESQYNYHGSTYTDWSILHIDYCYRIGYKCFKNVLLILIINIVHQVIVCEILISSLVHTTEDIRSVDQY